MGTRTQKAQKEVKRKKGKGKTGKRKEAGKTGKNWIHIFTQFESKLGK